jgi:Ca2+-binding RTX toxin-like protein
MSIKTIGILFIDPSVQDYQILRQGIVSGIEAVILDAAQDGVEQIAQVLSQRPKAESIHIVSHGSPGCLYLGNTQLSLSTLEHYSQHLQTWCTSSLLLYGCNVAAGDAGEEFLNKLHQLTKANIAASANLTGNAALGGDWKLEIQRGEVASSVAFKPEVLETYRFVFNTSPAYHQLANGDLIQDWSNSTLITTSNNWNNVPSIRGFRGDNLANSPGIDPQLVLADGSATPINVIANQSSPTGNTNSGIAEFSGFIGLRGSSVASAPHLVLYVDATGQQNVSFNFTLRDNDTSSGRNATQAVAVQYRIGNSGNFINLPAAFVPDASNNATTTSSSEAREARLRVLLPTEVNNQSQVQIRVITTDANGEDEWIGVDDIRVTSTAISANQSPTAKDDTYKVAANTTISTAVATTSLILDSDRGNYIGQSDYYSYTPATGSFGAVRAYPTNPSSNNAVRVFYSDYVASATWWDLEFAAPNNAPLTAGTTYTNVARFPFQTSGQPGLDVGGSGRGYNTLTGEFTIHQIIYGTDSKIISLDASFQEYGDGDPMTESFKGRIKYQATEGNRLPGVLTNDADAEKTTLRATLVSSTTNGTLAFRPDGSFDYTPNSGFQGIDTFTYRASDGITHSASVATVTLKVGNQAPIVNLGTASTPTYVENAAPITIASSNATVADEDSTNFETGTLTVSLSSGGTADDRLAIRNQGTSTGQINILGEQVFFGATQIGSFTGGTGTTPLAVTLNSQATPTATQALISNITFANISDNPTTTPRTISFVLSDGDGGTSTTVTRTINISPVNDAPIVTPNQTFSVNEKAPQGTVVGSVVATDPDSNSFSNWAIASGNLDVDNDGTTAFNINSTTGQITVNDSNDLNFTTHPNFQLQVSVSDGNNTSTPQTLTINLNQVQQTNGTSGNNRMIGGITNDIMSGDGGKDYLYGNAGADTLDGGDGKDYLYGGIGNDILNGGAGKDYLYGDEGNDNLNGGDGKDYLFGEEGNDLLNGGAGKDYLFGGEDDDLLNGGDSKDYLSGGAGDDLLNGGAGRDILYGNSGADTFVLATGDGTDTIADFEDGIDQLQLSGNLTYGALTFSTVSGSTLIRLTATNEVLATLSGLNSSLINQSDFVSV